MSKIGGPLPGEEEEDQNLIQEAVSRVGERSLKIGLKGIQKVGEAIDWSNDQVMLRSMTPIGKTLGQIADRTPTKWDDKILNYSYKDLRDHTAGGIGNVAGWTAERFGASKERAEQINAGFELGGQILLPDAVDFIGGVGYADNIAKGVSKLSDVKALKKVDYNQVLNSVFNPKRFSDGFKKLQEDAVTAVTAPVRTIRGAFEGLDAGTGGAKAMSGDGFIPRQIGDTFIRPNYSEIGEVTQELLNKNVLKDGVFSYDAFKKLYTNKDKISRRIASLLETNPFSRQPNWEKTRQELVDVFETIYGDVMQAKGLRRKDIHIDHLVQLRSTLPMFDGVAFGSPLWVNIQETLLRSKNKYKPGDTLANYNALDRGTDLVKTNFLNNRFGKDGEKFFNALIPHDGQLITRLEYMKMSDANRMDVVKEWLEIQDEGTEIMRAATHVWESLYKIDSAEMPQDIINRLAKIPIGEYTHPELRNLEDLQGIITDIISTGPKRGRKPGWARIVRLLNEEGIYYNPKTGGGTIQGNLFNK